LTTGSYNAQPSNPVSVTSSGSGSGATFNLTFAGSGPFTVSAAAVVNPGNSVSSFTVGVGIIGAATASAVRGTGYSITDVRNVSGAALPAAQLKVSSVGSTGTPTVASGGSGYTLGQVLTVAGGTPVGGLAANKSTLTVTALGASGTPTVAT